MKANFKKMITVLAASAMFAIPMANSLSASASTSFNTARIAEQTTFRRAEYKNIVEFQGDATLIKALQNDAEYMNILENASFDKLAEGEVEWCGNGRKYQFLKRGRRVVIIIIVGPIIVWPVPGEDPPRDYMPVKMAEQRDLLKKADLASVKELTFRQAATEKIGMIKANRS